MGGIDGVGDAAAPALPGPRLLVSVATPPR